MEEKLEPKPTEFSTLRCYAYESRLKQCKNVAAFYQRMKNDEIKWLCIEHVLPESMAAFTIAIK